MSYKYNDLYFQFWQEAAESTQTSLIKELILYCILLKKLRQILLMETFLNDIEKYRYLWYISGVCWYIFNSFINSSVTIIIRSKINLPHSLNLTSCRHYEQTQTQTHPAVDSLVRWQENPGPKRVWMTLTLLSAFLLKKDWGLYVNNSANRTHTRLHSSQKHNSLSWTTFGFDCRT